MAFTATIQSIVPQPDPINIGVVLYQVGVLFNDSATGFSQNKSYSFPLTTTQATAVAQITTDGNALKASLAGAGTLQQKVGTVLVI